jgi:hypothetical protein
MGSSNLHGRKAVKNSSWSEEHKTNFGDKTGYVICTKDGPELVAFATVFNAFSRNADLEKEAELIVNAPRIKQEHTQLLEALKATKEFCKQWDFKLGLMVSAQVDSAIEAAEKNG